MLLVRQYVLLGNIASAAQIADRTVDARPTDPDAAKLAVGVYQNASRWRDMKRSAEQWRRRTLEHPLEADLAIAEAELNLKDATGALNQLASYLPTIQAAPEGKGALVTTYARALAASGKAWIRRRAVLAIATVC